MKIHVRNLIKLIGSAIALSAVLSIAASLEAQTVTFSSSTLTDGYMSWSPTAYTVANFPGDGGSGSSGWGLSALPAVFSDTNILTLSPNVNTYAAGNTYWVNPDGTGANEMDGAIYNESDGVYVGASVTFTFNVLSNTLASGYTADAFIKDFGPGYSYNGEQTVNLTPGVDSVTYPLTGNNPEEIVQFGFELIGPDANPATVASLGSVVIEPVVEAYAIDPSPITSHAVVQGQSATFIEAPTGTGPFTYQWQFSGTNLINSGNYSGVTSSNLTISDAAPGDAGTYSVQISNLEGSNAVQSAYFAVIPLSQAETNYCIDPSFESDAFAPASTVGWYSYGGTAFANTNEFYSDFDGSSEYPDVTVIDGTNCLIEYSAGPGSYTGVFQTRPALPGQLYTAGLWYFTPTAEQGYPLVGSAYCNLEVQFYGTNGNLLVDYESGNFGTNYPEDEWTYMPVTNEFASDFVTLLGTGNYIISPPGTASMQIQPEYISPDATAGGDVYVDMVDVTLHETTPVVTRSGTSFQLSFPTIDGPQYNVMYTTNLLSGTWQTLSSVTGDGTVKTVSDTVGNEDRFYIINTSP